MLRQRNGVLAPAKAMADDLQIVRRLRSDFDPQAFGTMLIELTASLLASRGDLSVQELAALVMPELGHNWSIGGKPITEQHVRSALYSAAPALQALDLADPTALIWTAGPSAVTLLPGATLRAESGQPALPLHDGRPFPSRRHTGVQQPRRCSTQRRWGTMIRS